MLAEDAHQLYQTGIEVDFKPFGNTSEFFQRNTSRVLPPISTFVNGINYGKKHKVKIELFI
jgi:hypothetical protein